MKRLGTKTPLQKKLQQPFVKAANRPIPRKFDARQKLGPKNILDARDKIIINKKSGAGDARNKIVQKQVQKGTFDARSLLQRQAKKSKRRGKRAGNLPSDGLVQSGGLITRTLSNPGAQGRAQVQVTSSGLLVTRPIPSTQVSISGNSLQITKRTRPFESDLTDAVPIIQIRNDRYRQPAQQTVVIHASQPSNYLSQSAAKHSSYQSYNPQSYSYNEPYPSHRSYKDYDDPQYNPASIATDVPKIQISNMRPVETSVIRPVTYSGDFPSQTRGPPGAATVSQGAKLPLTKTVLQTTKLLPAGVKRRQAQQEVAGPLRLGKGGGPGIEMGTGDPSSLSKKAKVIPLVSDLDLEELQDDRSEIISPLQGFRVMVTNLFSGVTQDDIIELFGAVGPLKKAKLLKPGNAEVVYVNKEDALSAIQKYHSRELDGQPMYVKMTTPIAAVVKKAVGDVDPDITGEALRLYKKGSGIGSLPEAAVETATIHRALFKAGPPGPNKSVRFTVKI